MLIKTEPLRKYLKILNKIELSSILPDEIYIDFGKSLIAKSDGNMAINFTVDTGIEYPTPIAVPSLQFCNFFIYNESEEIDMEITAKQVKLKSKHSSTSMSYTKIVPSLIGREKIADLDECDVVITKEIIDAIVTSVSIHTDPESYGQMQYVYMTYKSSLTFYAGTSIKMVQYVTPTQSADFQDGIYIHPDVFNILKKIGHDFEVMGNDTKIAFDSGRALVILPRVLSAPLPYDIVYNRFPGYSTCTVPLKSMQAAVKIVSTIKEATEHWFTTMTLSVYKDKILLRTEDSTGNADASVPLPNGDGSEIPLHYKMNYNHVSFILSKFKGDSINILYSIEPKNPVGFESEDCSLLVANGVVI